MDRLHGLLAVAALAAVIAGAGALFGARAWEQRAHAAEQYADASDKTVDSLQHVAAKAEANAARRDTVRITLTKLIAHTDSVSRPDSSCGPSLKARDAAIAAANDEVAQWQTAFHAQIEALSRLTAEKDTLRSALGARPHAGITLELLHPELHLSVVAMLYPAPRVGIALSYDLARIRL